MLRLLANNENRGWIQRITQQGRPNQYYRNLENNNHWHDLILLIKEIIDRGEPSKERFKPLVFKWDGNKNTDRLRSSLSPNFGSRALVQHLIENVSEHRNSLIKRHMIKDITNILKYKKQIILQGPPGTGKTRLAKMIAKEMFVSNDRGLLSLFQLGDTIPTYHGDSSYKIDSIDDQDIVLSGGGSEIEPKTIKFDQIISFYRSKRWLSDIKNGNDRGACALAYNLYCRSNDSINILQFHPSYSYEDFVRGIVAKSSGSGIEYVVENKILGDLIEKAYQNRSTKYVLIIDEINRANLSSVFGELIYALEYRYQFNDNEEDTKLHTVQSMYGVINAEGEIDNSLCLPENLYIIGTMNTADRSVGHIDYAIRRRFAFIDVLPKNLESEEGIYFDQKLFSDVSSLFVQDFDLGNDYSKPNTSIQPSQYLSQEFRPQDVWLGHSYFIQKIDENGIKTPESMQVRLDYEIKPILMEYIKDGVLKPDALSAIDKLEITDKK